MLTIFSDFIIIAAILLLVVAAYNDIRSLRIPNSICLAVSVLGLLRLFLLWWLGDLAAAAVLETMATAAIILLIGLVAFMLRFIGGGDVKLIVATVLLIDGHNWFPFIMIMSISGGVLAMLMLALKHSPIPTYLGPRFAAFALTTKVMVPYGVAISVAGSITLFTQLYLDTAIRAF